MLLYDVSQVKLGILHVTFIISLTINVQGPDKDASLFCLVKECASAFSLTDFFLIISYCTTFVYL